MFERIFEGHVSNSKGSEYPHLYLRTSVVACVAKVFIHSNLRIKLKIFFEIEMEFIDVVSH